MPKKSKTDDDLDLGSSSHKEKKKLRKKAKSTMDLMAGGMDLGNDEGKRSKKKKLPKKSKSMSKIPVEADEPTKRELKRKPKKSKSLSKIYEGDNDSRPEGSKETKKKKKKKKSKGGEESVPSISLEGEPQQQQPGERAQEQPVSVPAPAPESAPVSVPPPEPPEDATEQQPASMHSLVDSGHRAVDPDDPDALNNSQMIEELPPIGEIVASTDDADNVSDIAEAIVDDVAASTMVNGEQIIYNPDDTDICFDDRGHQGTKDWIAVIRECLTKFEGQEYSPPVYKAIKKKLKGRRFLIRTRRNERTSWREASKPEVIELFGECFNEERRRQNEGIADDDSEIDDSLQNSAQQSEESLSLGIITQDKTKGNQTPTKPPNRKLARAKSSDASPHLAPTPRHANSGDPSASPPRRTKSETVPTTSGPRNGQKVGRGTPGDEKAALMLHLAITECQNCEEFISPYDETTLLEQGIAAEQKLQMLISLADGPQTDQLRVELEKIDDLATRMKHASMAPMLEILSTIERRMTDYFQTLAEQASESSFRANVSPEIASRQDEYDDAEESDDEGGGPAGGGGARHRSIPMNSDRASRSSPRSRASRMSKESRDRAAQNVPSVASHTEYSKGDNSEEQRRNGYRIHNDSAASALVESGELNGVGPHHLTDHGEHGSKQGSDESFDSEEGDLRSDRSGRDHAEGGDYIDQEEPLADSASGSVSLGEPLRETYEMPLGGSYDESSRFGGASQSGRSYGMMSSDEVRYDRSEGEEELERESSQNETDEEPYVASVKGSQGSDDESPIEEDSYGVPVDNNQSGEVSYETDPEDEAYDEMDPSEDIPDEEVEGEYELEEGDNRVGRDVGDEGSQSLKDGIKSANLDGSSGNMGGDHVLELSERGLINDDMSSVGRSMPGIYGSDSDSEDGDEYSDYEEEVVEDDELSDDDRSNTDRNSDSDESESNTEATPVKIAHEDTPNPKVEQFFDRLQHFFEVRRKIEERADLMDPSGKFRGLKVKNHADGIQEKSGLYKQAYQQHDLHDKVVRNLDDLYDAAEPAQVEFKRVMHTMLNEVKGMDVTCLAVPPLKGRDRAYEKAKQEYSEREPGPAESWLYDVVRASVFCKSYKQMNDVNKWIGNHLHIVSSKNRFAEPAFNGYRDLMFHVSLPYKGQLAHICEIQVHHKDIKALDLQYGLPKHYEYFRSSFAGPWRSQHETLEDLALMNKHGDIGGQVMKKLLKSKDPDQLRLIGGICHKVLDEYDRALELYRRLLIMQEDFYGGDHEDVASTHLSLGLVLGAKGDTDESLGHLQKALRMQESLLGSDHLKVSETQTEIGHMLITKGDFAGALEEFQNSQQIREAKLGKEHFLVINSLQDIGRALRELGEYKNSEAEFRRALKIQEAVLGDVHNDAATTQAMIGTTLCQYGDFGKAMESHRLALQIRETNLGKNHPQTAQSHTDIGIVLCQKGDYDVAEWRHKKALRIREAVLGKEDAACAESHIHIGNVLSRKGKFDDSIISIKRGQTIREHHLGMDNTETAGSYLELGKVYLEKKDYDEALKEFRRAKVVRESFLGQQHPDTALAYNCLGDALNLRGDHDAALVEHRKALAIYEESLGKNHPKTATGYQCIADALLAKGERDEALIEHRKALSVRANVLAKDHPDTAVSCARIGNLLYQKGDLVGASVAYRQALAITVGLCGEQHPESAKAHIHVGKVLAAQGDCDEALEEVEQAANVLAASLGKDHEQAGLAYSLLGTIYGMAENHEEALAFHQKAIPIIEKSFGKKSPEAMEARKKLMFAENEEPPPGV